MNSFVIADNRKCIGCFACMAACVESHRQAGLQAYPRLYVTRSPAGMIPLQCRHCEEALCELVCPVQAITQRERRVFLNETLCIGCKLCALACPYGAIIAGGTPVPGQTLSQGQYALVNDPYLPDPMYLRQLSAQELLSLLAWNTGQKTVAVKCDLCAFSERGPACVAACPHKALRLVEEDELQESPTLLQLKDVAGAPEAAVR
ncbi:MAG: 4Fe-4S dicluster domain-containing protein [Chloroflexota bacterium]